MPKLKEIPLRCLGSVKESQFGVLLLLRQIRCWALLEKSKRRRRRKRALRGPLKIRNPKMKVRCKFYLRKLLTPMEVQVLTGVKAFQNLWSQLFGIQKRSLEYHLIAIIIQKVIKAFSSLRLILTRWFTLIHSTYRLI